MKPKYVRFKKPSAKDIQVFFLFDTTAMWLRREVTNTLPAIVAL